MLLQKNVFEKLEVPFVKKGEEIQSGNIVTITGGVKERDNRFDPNRKQQIIKIKTEVGERYIGLNQESINILIDEFGSNDDKDWIGKNVKVLLAKKTIGNNRVIIAYLVGNSWELDDYQAPINPNAQKEPTEDIPTINLNEEEIPQEEVKIEDVPF